jgi:hypothetical protein
MASRYANACLLTWQTKEGLWSHLVDQITPVAFLQPLPLFGAFLLQLRILSFQKTGPPSIQAARFLRKIKSSQILI